jgi:hypothetical protein
MALKNLSPAAMVSISSSWLDPARDRALIEALLLVAPILPALGQVHGDLLSKQHLRASLESEVASLVEAEAEADGIHDRSKRGVHTFLSALAELTRDPARTASYLDLRDRLMPLGMMEVRRPYLEQVGDAEALPARLNPPARALLESIITPEGPLQSHVDRWISAAGDLGRLEKRRAELEVQRTTDQSVSASHAHAAKLTWIRVVRAMLNLIEVDPAATPEIKDRLLAPLYRAEAQADRRARGPVVDDGEDDDLPALPAPSDPTAPIALDAGAGASPAE